MICNKLLLTTLREISPQTADAYETLASCYQEHLIHVAMGSVVAFSTSEIVDAMAWEIVKTLESIPPVTRSYLDILSMSYDEILTEQQMTGAKLTRLVQRHRQTLRRSIGMARDSDSHEHKFQADKIQARKNFTIYEDPTTGFRISAEDSYQRRKRQNRARDWAISQCLHDSAITLLGMSETFQSLTLDGPYHSMSVDSCHVELSRRIEGIKRNLKRKGIDWLATYKIHKSVDETPHVHFISYVLPEQQNYFDRVISKWFPGRYESDNQTVWDSNGVNGYLFSDHQEDDVRVGFVGLRRDIRKIHDQIYKREFAWIPLSMQRILLASRIMNGDFGWSHEWLAIVRGFRNNRLNQMVIVGNSKKWHFGKHENIYIKIRNVKSYVISILKTCQVVCTWHEVAESRGQPPPEGKRLILPNGLDG